MPPPSEPARNLDAGERRLLLTVARESIAAAVQGQSLRPECPPPGMLSRTAGVFVTIHVAGDLRGCIGDLSLREPLYIATAGAARNAALHDPRFRALEADEAASAAVEISVLSAPVDIEPQEIRERILVGTHGLIVSDGFHRGLLLPQVAPRYGWDAVEFVRQTCRKAGLPPDAWQRGVRVQAFTAQVFSDADLTAAQVS